ncbi:PREDICTED: uncharacterized protein C10orf67, mitochondrial-like [Branchiostoma belcheri]|uniref:Uncharacterized protein C10orf67, mitochondrial-like n=1 Tax=Branchiostoma belcheri TaxID=7741 RepID=A0A6P5AVE4_BRABE|nr:PREDICTED: uncharacterized protein C10orf67, mitochondrial-like [Branchiostoma belcheri]KAI8515970.1 hypothetical protein Bbelb_067830 [Branchiostoma belcheri]
MAVALLEKRPNSRRKMPVSQARRAMEEEILALQAGDSDDDDFLGPSIADQMRVGFFSQDRSCQTEHSEIVGLKRMTEVLNNLVQDARALRKDLHFSKQVLQADYEAKLQAKALDLYCRVNDKLEDLEKIHLDKMQVVRKSFRQQLADAMVKIANQYKNYYSSKLNLEHAKQSKGKSAMTEKYKELQAQIQRNESIIQMLQMQLKEYQENADVKVFNYEDSEGSKSDGNEQQVEELKLDIAKLQDKVDDLQDTLETRDDTIDNLNAEISLQQDKLEKEKAVQEELRQQIEELRAQMESDKATNRRMLEKQRLDLERQMQEQVKSAKSSALSQAQQLAKEAEEAEKQRQREMEAQRKRQQELLAKQEASMVTNSNAEEEVKRLKKLEMKQAEEIARLKKDLDRTNRTWEKKFAILKQSLHALKDESYIRQTLQKQAATLHHATIAYNTEVATSAPPSQQGPRKQPAPLPRIQKSRSASRTNNRRERELERLEKHTNSAPSGRGTEVFSTAESDVVGSDEDVDMGGVLPLPSPPPRAPSQCSVQEMASRPSTSSHVVVLPSAEPVQ